MRLFGMFAATAILLVACGSPENAPTLTPGSESEPEPAATKEGLPAPGGAGGSTGSARWDLQSSSEGVALARLADDGRPAIRLFCPAGGNRLLVNVSAFRPIGSEERLSLGSDAGVVALVADPQGDARRGGVSAAGEVPEDLKALVTGPLTASYGAQQSGPHPVVPDDLARGFVSACNRGLAAARQAASRPNASTSPCLVQDGELIRMTPLRAVGTEPFWGARIEGRCVTYSDPENQKGTRIWTRLNDGPDGGIWVGALDGRRFVLRTRPAVNCSDGMSDKRYQLAVELLVHGEQRSGCAEPL